MNGLREFVNSGVGKMTMVGAALVVGAIVIFSLVRFFGASDVARLSRDGLFIDATTGKPFNYEIRPGSKVPVPAPSGKNTGYPAEMCWWSKDGKIRPEPYLVLLNHYAGKPEPTFCPDCGRLVTPQNPPPTPGEKPPPTESEYRQGRTGAAGVGAGN